MAPGRILNPHPACQICTPRYHGISIIALYMASMNKTLPQFVPQLTKGGRWFVAVTTGNGPDSHIGDFETEAQARAWITSKSKYWPGKATEAAPTEAAHQSLTQTCFRSEWPSLKNAVA